MTDWQDISTAPKRESLFAVMARTARTDWVELNVFETRKEAMELADNILSTDRGTEVAIEERLLTPSRPNP